MSDTEFEQKVFSTWEKTQCFQTKCSKCKQNLAKCSCKRSVRDRSGNGRNWDNIPKVSSKTTMKKKTSGKSKRFSKRSSPEIQAIPMQQSPDFNMDLSVLMLDAFYEEGIEELMAKDLVDLYANLAVPNEANFDNSLESVVYSVLNTETTAQDQVLINEIAKTLMS
jgi:hypothetical protein